LQTLRMRRHHLDSLSLVQVYLVSKFCPSVMEILIFEFLLGSSETLLCSVSAPQIKTVPVLDAHQLLMLFARTLT
jgi:hypothetical protein